MGRPLTIARWASWESVGWRLVSRSNPRDVLSNARPQSWARCPRRGFGKSAVVWNGEVPLVVFASTNGECSIYGSHPIRVIPFSLLVPACERGGQHWSWDERNDRARLRRTDLCGWVRLLTRPRQRLRRTSAIHADPAPPQTTLRVKKLVEQQASKLDGGTACVRSRSSIVP